MILSPSIIFKWFDDNNDPANGWKLYTYIAGTSDPIATYTDSTGASENTNPIVLNARGEARLWLDPSIAYKFIVTTPTGDPLSPEFEEDNITSGGGGGSGLSRVYYNDSNSIDFSGLGTSATPLSANVKLSAYANNALQIRADGLYAMAIGGGGSVAWGSITGSINAQADLIAKFGEYLPLTFASPQVLTYTGQSAFIFADSEFVVIDTNSAPNQSNVGLRAGYGLAVYNSAGFTGLLDASAVTADRTWTLPNATGTIALTSDIPSLSGYVQKAGDTMTGSLQINAASAFYRSNRPDDNTSNRTHFFATRGSGGGQAYSINSASASANNVTEIFHNLDGVNVIGFTKTALTLGVATSVSGNLTATNLIRSGGTSAQFLKADGSVDSSVYAAQSWVTAGFQPLDAELTALSALSGSSGLIRRTGSSFVYDNTAYIDASALAAYIARNGTTTTTATIPFAAGISITGTNADSSAIRIPDGSWIRPQTAGQSLYITRGTNPGLTNGAILLETGAIVLQHGNGTHALSRAEFGDAYLQLTSQGPGTGNLDYLSLGNNNVQLRADNSAGLDIGATQTVLLATGGTAIQLNGGSSIVYNSTSGNHLWDNGISGSSEKYQFGAGRINLQNSQSVGWGDMASYIQGETSGATSAQFLAYGTRGYHKWDGGISGSSAKYQFGGGDSAINGKHYLYAGTTSVGWLGFDSGALNLVSVGTALTLNSADILNYSAVGNHKWDGGISGSTSKYQFNGSARFAGQVDFDSNINVGGITTTAGATIGGNVTVGGTLGVTGALSGSSASFSSEVTGSAMNAATFRANVAPGNVDYQMRTAGGTPRWYIFKNGAESTGDAGSNWTLRALNDAGNAIDDVIVITRAAGGNINLARNLVGTSASFSGLVSTPESTTASAGLRIPHGTAPTSPVNGDIWTTTSGLVYRINGATRTSATLDSQTFAGTQTFNIITATNTITGRQLATTRQTSATATGAITWTLSSGAMMDLTSTLTGAVTMNITAPAGGSRGTLFVTQGATPQTVTLSLTGVSWILTGTNGLTGTNTIVIPAAAFVANKSSKIELDWSLSTKCYVSVY